MRLLCCCKDEALGIFPFESNALCGLTVVNFKGFLFRCLATQEYGTLQQEVNFLCFWLTLSITAAMFIILVKQSGTKTIKSCIVVMYLHSDHTTAHTPDHCFVQNLTAQMFHMLYPVALCKFGAFS